MIRVLVIDDSAFVRKTVGAILERSPGLMVVGYAGDGEEGLEQVRRLKPDVVTVDLEMPRMNGVKFIEAQMASRPLPIVVVSSVDRGGALAAQSMRAGAMEFVLKPTHLANHRLAEIESDLIAKVHAVSEIDPKGLDKPFEYSLSAPAHPDAKGTPTAIVIGVSTGGPQLLHQILPKFPADFPVPLAAVIHMPVGFTGTLAERLNLNSAIEVKEASPGLAMRAGRCILGQAGQHLRLHRDGPEGVSARLSFEPFDIAYRPAVDVLFQSAAECYGPGLLALVLTGMGQDGKEGSAWIKAGGGRVYTQNEASSVVWGMPRSVYEAGLSDGELAPHEIVPFLVRLAAGR